MMVQALNTKSTQELLSDSLTELLLKRPMQEISVKQIADNCGVSRNTFYYYFQDKYDLMSWGLFKDKQVLTDTWLKTHDWDATALAMAQYFFENRDYFRSAYKYGGQNSVAETIYQAIYDTYERAILSSELPSGLDRQTAEFAVSFMAHGVSGKLRDWVLAGTPVSPETFAKQLKPCIPHFMWDRIASM